MAIVRHEVSERTFFGKLVKWTFVGFNVLMILWLFAGFSATSDGMDEAVNDAQRAGTALGATVGMGLLIGLWAMGDIVLGIMVLLTRRKKIIEVEE